MMKILLRTAVFLAFAFSFFSVTAQSPRETPRARDQKPAIPAEVQPEPTQDIETLKIDTNLVTVPVIASSRTGAYIADLRREEFKLSEDGVPQEIAFFATVNAPFQVVLLLDTSASTEEKLGQIQRAAAAFVNQLSPQDKTKVISFDEELRDLNEFTSDQKMLRAAIGNTHSGHGTRVYDALQMALDVLRPIPGRKAVVIFTDGVDWHSESSTFESTIRDLDESGVIVYPIRFDTRAETEKLARKQQQETNGSQLPTSDIIRQPPNGTTPTTFPSDEPFPTKGIPRSPLPIPPPSVIFGPRQTPNPPDPRADPVPNSGATIPPTRPGPPRPTPSRDDSLSAMLDSLYLMADSYLKELAERSGGQLYRADTVGVLPPAFAAIAAELRTQYLLGYYPINREHDGAYRKIQVKTSRKDIAIRARPGYRARTGN